MSRSLVLFLASLAVLLPACSEPAVGHCTGTLAGAPFDADIDPESEHHPVNRESCVGSVDRTRWLFSYGGGALQISALSSKVVLGGIFDRDYDLPAPGTDWYLGDGFEQWTVVAPPDATLKGGQLTVSSSYLDFSRRLNGHFHLVMADGSAMECTFELPEGPGEGRDLDCPDEHGSSGDWDDD